MRVVIEQVPANAVSRPAEGLLHTLMRKTNPPSKKAKL
ncbi:hypothetical protein [Citromicrobium phage vB_Cib_ssDNA_P1]|nr:hypothetical protein [Citromicrobium phage vB_Cib_ssDNA_P1]